ncbi:unnamed protein product [Allacma fusca]|uniref:Uncharacterized protein n=1 Tax=Allacma fusca TaxID=39272 RepID=A0A8J2PRU0_9HEXA|nr:unnamed protein product [Allacma fusca]
MQENARKEAEEANTKQEEIKSKTKRDLSSQVLNEETSSGIFSTVGWLNRDTIEGMMGFGNCDVADPPSSIGSTEDAAIFYLTLLRQQCCPQQVNQVMKLVAMGALVLTGDNSLEVPNSCSLL